MKIEGAVQCAGINFSWQNGESSKLVLISSMYENCLQIPFVALPTCLNMKSCVMMGIN